MTTELILLPRVSYRGQEITGPRMRGLLALLAADLRTGCSAAGLVEGLWPDRQPENPVKALQVLVSRARAQLGSGVVGLGRPAHGTPCPKSAPAADGGRGPARTRIYMGISLCRHRLLHVSFP